MELFECYRQLKQVDSALVYAEKMMAFNHDTCYAIFNKAQVANESELWYDVLDYCEEGLQYEKSKSKLRKQLFHEYKCHAFASLGRIDEACDCAEKFIPEYWETMKDSVCNESLRQKSVLILPCSNGYDFSTSNLDIEPILEDRIEESECLWVLPFPYKVLMGTGYLGVFDKKNCDGILEKVTPDFIVMSRLEGALDQTTSEGTWGYAIRILNTKTMKQTNSAEAHNLKDWDALTKSLDANAEKLLSDFK